MRFPHPFNAVRLPDASGATNCASWSAIDEKVRVHNLAKRVAMLPNKIARNDYVAELATKHKHKPDFIVRFKRLVKWYWRAQRKLQQSQG